MTRSLTLALIPAALVGILLGCGRQEPPPAPAPEREAKVTPQQQQPTDPAKDAETKDAKGDGQKQAEGLASSQKGDDAKQSPSSSEAKPEPRVEVFGALPPSLPPGTSTGSPPRGGKPAGFGGGFQGGGAGGLGAPGGGRPATGPGGLAGGGWQPGSGTPAPQLSKIPAGGTVTFAAPARGGDGKPAARPQDGAQAQPAQGQQPPGDNASGAEKYGSYRENEFRSPLAAPLSTFSADVNTASYANVRRMLQQGSMPVRDAVFLAEFVNYFPYKYAQPKGEDPIEYNLEIGPCPWNRKHLLVRVGVQAYQIPRDKMPPRNLVFLLDTSGSMSAPNRLPLVKQAMSLLVDQLGEKDRVSIVTYAGEVNVSLVGAKGSEKDTIKEAINRLDARGSTYGEGGIKKAYELARETFIDGGVNRVILCTDGDFNVGVTDQGELVRMIEQQRRSKVFLTILGFGMGNYKDETLKELANHGNGHHAYIDTLDEAKKVFVDQGASLVCVAKDVKFQADFNPARVAAYRLIGYENRLLKDEDFRNDAKDAGDMGSGHQTTVLYEIIPVGVPTNLPEVEKSKYTTAVKLDPSAPDEWLTVRMRYKHPEADTSKELSKALPGKALGQELSDDFRFAAAAASFGMLLRESEFRGAMTYAGVLEEAQGCLANDPGGHRKEFLELVKKAKDLAAPRATGSPNGNN